MSRQLEETLAPRDAARLSQHLATCARCRALDAAMRRAEGLIGRPAWPDTTPNLTSRVVARLPGERRAVVPPAPAWVRASVVVAAAVVLLFVGLTGALLLGEMALGDTDLALVGEGGRSVALAGWDGLLHIRRALGTLAGVFWQALRWPWMAVAGAGAVAAAAVWAWLWRRSLRGG